MDATERRVLDETLDHYLRDLREPGEDERDEKLARKSLYFQTRMLDERLKEFGRVLREALDKSPLGRLGRRIASR